MEQQPHTVYFNHAGTSWPKPDVVVQAASSVLTSDPASWPAMFDTAHHTIAKFFHVDPSRLLLTPSCTAAISLAVMDHDWSPGDRVVTSGFEHHALQRTLVKLGEQGVSVATLPVAGEELIDLSALEDELKSGRVRLVALTAACNVTGQLLPISDAVELAHRYGALALIDGAQIAGWWDLDLTELQADLFTFAGHKAPHAPWGVGGLYVAPGVSMNCPLAVCERPDSASSPVCAPMPGYCDAGSVNLAAMAGMAAAVKWLREPEQSVRLQHARGLAGLFAERLRDWPEVNLHGDVPSEQKVPTVAVSVKSKSASDIAATLRQFGVVTSAGVQCAPAAHHALGTADGGVIRFSFGPQNQAEQVLQAVQRFETAVR